MSFLIFSCSKKDKTEPEGSGSNNNQKEQLQLTASSTEVKEGSEVTFEVTADGNTVTADIYINTNKISGSSYTFDQAGEYTVIAKKDGYPNSEGLKITVKAPVLFMAGYTLEGGDKMAAYWKDGTPVQLGDRSKYVMSVALGITVNDGDVYVAGAVVKQDQPTAVYWKNGEMTELGSSGVAYDIAIHDGKVIAVGVVGDVVGSGNQEAVKWEDGSKFVFHEDEIAAMLAITTDDQKVYTTGIYQDNNGDAATFFWRDIDGYFLDDGRFGFHYDPLGDGLMSIAVKDEDVYVAGPSLGANYDGYATYWKNGNPIALNTGTGLGAAFCVTVSDGDVYLSGVIESHKTNSGYALAYWKNEQLHETSEDILIHGNDVAMTSIAVNDGKVYMAEKVGGEGSILYKDGVRKELDGAFIYNITIGYE